MSLLRLHSLDRSSLGFSRRLSLLPMNTTCSNVDEEHSNPAFVRNLPSVECSDNDDFLNMFGNMSEEFPRGEFRPIAGTRDRGLLPELSATPSSSQFQELHGTSTQRFELAPSPMPQIQLSEQSHAESGQMVYRSSVSSSIPSTKKSNASSRISRRSSMSSVTEYISSSDRSSKDSDQENELHARLKRRSKEKRVSFARTKAPTPVDARRSYSTSPQLFQDRHSNTRSLAHDVPATHSTSPRPFSRGKRLGQAMSERLAVSPQAQAIFKDRPIAMSTRNLRQGLTSPPVRASTRLSRFLNVPVIDNSDRIRVGIMSSLDTLHDLQACAQVSRDFHQAFHKYETLLVDAVLFKQSSAAWELRCSVRQANSSPFRLRSVLRDFATMQALEDFIIGQCQSTLRPQSLAAFLGEDASRKAELEDAIWLTWTFCNTFGKTSTSDGSMLEQTQWLNGVQASGKKTVLSHVTRGACNKRQLEDMSEIWRCLEMLLSGFKGREQEARTAGIFDNAEKSRLTDRELLTAWIHDILSLGPKAVLTLSSCDFDQARVLGITRWTPPSKGKARANFLKAAVEEVYRDRLMKEARQKALDYRKSVKIQHHHKRSSSDSASSPPKVPPKSSVSRSGTQSLLLDTQPSFRQSMPLQSVLGSKSQVELRPDCDPLSPSFLSPVLSPSSNPTVFQPLSMTKNVSTRLGPTLFPMQNRDQSHRLSIAARSSMPQLDSEQSFDIAVSDPTDEAVVLMVREMGFFERDVKRALAMSDTGAGIDIEAAIEILSADTKVTRPKRRSQICELPASADGARLMNVPKINSTEICEGHCKPMLLVEPRRDRVSGLGMVKRGLSYRMSFRRSTTLSMIPDAEEGGSLPQINNTRKQNSALARLATSAVTTFTPPVLSQNLLANNASSKDILPALPEHSPVSPVVPAAQAWLKPDSNPIANTPRTGEENVASLLQVKPRITLQRVGTGVRKTGWNIPGMKRREHITEPEIIGYEY